MKNEIEKKKEELATKIVKDAVERIFLRFNKQSVPADVGFRVIGANLCNFVGVTCAIYEQFRSKEVSQTQIIEDRQMIKSQILESFEGGRKKYAESLRRKGYE